jgi:hypothetical protein
MTARHAFRPTFEGALEVRAVPSRGHALATIAALGDSYTDEYRNYPPDRTQARNWLEILAATHRASFGRVVPVVPVGGGRTGHGFADNLARSNATTDVMLHTELPALLGQAAKGGISYVAIFIGGDDFLYFLQHVATGVVARSGASAALAQVESNAEANLRATVGTLLTSDPGLRLAVATVPDVSLLPIVRQYGPAVGLQSVVADVSQAIRTYNSSILRLAAGDSRVAVVDLAATTAPLASAPATEPFGGATIDLSTPGDDYHHFFLADGIHTGTVAQGLIANAFVSTLDTAFGAGISPLSPTQIVRFARSVQLASRHGGGPV